MNRWLIVHSPESYEQNPNVIGFKRKIDPIGSKPELDELGQEIPENKEVLKIREGDLVVYYVRSKSVIIGIFKVERAVHGEEKAWPDHPFQFRIEPVVVPESPVPMKPLVPQLELFGGLEDLSRWGSRLQGPYNTVKELSQKDYSLISKTLELGAAGSEEEPEGEVSIAERETHMEMVRKIAELGLDRGSRVHIATDIKGRIKLPGLLENVPPFHAENVAQIANRIDVTYFEKDKDVLASAFEVEHKTTIYSGLLRLNDMAQSLGKQRVRFFVVGPEERRDKFNRELDRPSFKELREFGCDFVPYDEIDQMYKDMKSRRPTPF